MTRIQSGAHQNPRDHDERKRTSYATNSQLLFIEGHAVLPSPSLLSGFLILGAKPRYRIVQ